jgi:hypothetical protein
MDQDKNVALPDPATKPDVPTWAEKMNIFRHIRHQLHLTDVNEHGFLDINGPKEYVSLDLRCPICKHIQPLGPPGVEGKCGKCSLHYKYTAAKGNCFIWIWRPREAFNLDPVTNPDRGTMRRLLQDGPIEVQRAFEPGTTPHSNASNMSQSGLLILPPGVKRDAD